MAIIDFVQRHGRKLAVAAAVVGTVAFTATPQPAQARDGAGVALGVLGGAVAGAAIAGAANNYYNPYYPYGYYAPPAAPAYYPPAPAYAPRNCWDPYYRRYYAC